MTTTSVFVYEHFFSRKTLLLFSWHKKINIKEEASSRAFCSQLKRRALYSLSRFDDVHTCKKKAVFQAGVEPTISCVLSRRHNQLDHRNLHQRFQLCREAHASVTFSSSPRVLD